MIADQPARIEKFKKTMAAKQKAQKKPLHDITLAVTNANAIYDEYYDFNDKQVKIFTHATAIRWSDQMVEFAKRPDTLKVTDWLIDNGIMYETAMQLCRKYEVLDAEMESLRKQLDQM